MSINVLVVDGHHIVRQGIARLLEERDDVASVQQASSGEEALRKAREEARPDLVVMDLRLHGILHGVDLAAALHRERPDLPVIVLTNESRRSMVDAALQAGARGYLLKTGTLEELTTAIDTARGGGTYVTPDVGRGGVEGNGLGGHESPLRTLSRRERQVLTLIARGGTTKSIAGELGISPKTVEKHRGKLARKLDLHSVAELTRFAIENEMA